jgi:RNA polymerase sigma factor (sigma-70 family)
MDQKVDEVPDAPDWFTSQIQSLKLRGVLINLARRKGIPADDREDIASEAITRALSNQQEYDRNRGSFFSWIMGITENVIRAYYRKLNAQKRKAEGGTISLDAAPDSEEPKDAFVENQRASEELEHFIGTTKLSEKERKTIARQRQETTQTEPKISRSTARRARAKLKQAKSDEKFGECPRGPDAPECAYGKIPAAERSAAILFDQLRRTPWFVDAIADWRKSPEWKKIQAYLENERALKRFPLIILRTHWPERLFHYRQAAHERDVVLRRRFEAAVEIPLAFPEWPKLGYCRLAPSERRKRLEEFGWTFGAEPFWEITERTLEIIINAADETQQAGTSLAALLDLINNPLKTGSDVHSSTHLVRIDRRYPLKTILASVKKWANKQQRRGLQQIAQAGRPATTHSVGFACIRLVDDFGLSMGQAMSWLKERYGGPVPATPERLERAVKATRDALKNFLPPPAEMGL